MADNDHICIYRQFFEEFASTSKMEISRPLRVNPYDLSVDELIGEVMYSSVNYLVERKCPRSLVVPLTKIVVEEFINGAKKEPEEVNTPLKLNKKTHDKISEVCLRFTDNEKLSSLPQPVEETFYSTHSTKHIRRQMEDRLICLPRFHALHSIQSNSEAGYYGIFDGHNGVSAACYAVSHLHQFLAESECYPDNPAQAFLQAFEKTEYKYNSKDENSGTTALAILHQPAEKKLTVAWVGDSQAMLVNEDSFFMLIDPHKPERVDERRRIEALGGCVIKAQSVYRVNGGLAISRAIGDKKLKPYISAEPDIRVLDLSGSEHFIVMGSDGLWDVVEPLQVIETVYFEVKKNQGQVDSVAAKLVDLAKENNSTDNISVIVIFLTDPADISNRSVDVTGHRPKILHQDGAIMEANFQTNDKTPLNEPGMNGIYETNGTHFNDPLQNESDEDFGPETDVDAGDDVLTSTKNPNPFAKDCWQKTSDETSDKLIELPTCIENEIIKFAEGFDEASKTYDDKNSNQINNIEIRSDKFSEDNMNPFETPFTNHKSESFNISQNLSEDNYKYIDEINSKKEEVESLKSPKIVDLAFDLGNNSEQEKNLQEIAGDNFTLDDDGLTSGKLTVSSSIVENKNLSFDEESNPELKKSVENLPLESEIQEKLLLECSVKSDAKETGNSNPYSIEINTTLNKLDEFRELDFKTNEQAVNLFEQEQNTVLDHSEIPPVFCSVIDTVEAEKVSSDFYPEETAAPETGDKTGSDLLSPSALVLDGELKDETVAESGGEVEDSEDDEWSYIKVKSETHEAVPVSNEVNEVTSPFNEVLESEISTMNSPLNPEADEFIPESALSNNNDYNLKMTPKKAIPDDLTDIIASSPNWNNMDNVSVPEESTFLTEIKSRPSNIFENIDSTQQENFGEKHSDMNNSLNFIPTGEIGKENELLSPNEKELHGIDLACDMTSSFIDPSTMSSEIETPKEKFDAVSSQIVSPSTEIQDLHFNESAPKVQEVANEECSSKLPDLLSPVPAQEDVPLLTSSAEVLKMNVAETQASEPVFVGFSQSPSEETHIKERNEVSQETVPSKKEQLVEEAEMSSEMFSKSPDKSELQEAVKADVVEPTAVKKDAKKSTSAATPATKLKATSTSKVMPNEIKSSMTLKKPPSLSQTTKVSTSGKTAGVTPALSAKTTGLKTSMTKSQPKLTSSISSTVSKAPARPRPSSAISQPPKASPPSKTTVTTSPRKPTTTSTTNNTLKPTNKTSGSTSVSAISKSRPKAPSTIEKTVSAINGEAKSTVKRTETTIKKPGGTNTTTMTTRVSLSFRPATATAKPTALKTTSVTTRVTTAKPRTITTTTTANLISPSSKASPASKKLMISADKQAKEAANRLTSKAAPKPNGVAPRSAASTVTKTRKSLASTTTTTATPSSAKNLDKTENKAEKILNENVEIIQSEIKAPLISNNAVIENK